MSFLVLAYPLIADADRQWIQSHRKIHDELYYEIVDPHFTFVFPVTNITEELFTAEIILQAEGQACIEFEISSALVNKDAFKPYYHQFLVPGKGYEEMIDLHDKLYSGILSSHHRLDIEYIPHIGIGNSTDENKIKEAVKKLNENDIHIPGSIEKLCIVKYEQQGIRKIKEIFLA